MKTKLLMALLLVSGNVFADVQATYQYTYSRLPDTYVFNGAPFKGTAHTHDFLRPFESGPCIAAGGWLVFGRKSKKWFCVDQDGYIEELEVPKKK